MNQLLQNKLYEKYPKLFENRYKTMQESCMYWGVSTGDGWFHIIDVLCNGILNHETYIMNPKWPRYNPNYIPVTFDQIKEKFGGLSVYYSGGDEYVKGLVAIAQHISYYTCEVCGDKGSTNKTGWISTLCDKHRQDRVSK
jgi:hypothetical protein